MLHPQHDYSTRATVRQTETDSVAGVKGRLFFRHDHALARAKIWPRQSTNFARMRPRILAAVRRLASFVVVQAAMRWRPRSLRTVMLSQSVGRDVILWIFRDVDHDQITRLVQQVAAFRAEVS